MKEVVRDYLKQILVDGDNAIVNNNELTNNNNEIQYQSFKPKHFTHFKLCNVGHSPSDAFKLNSTELINL